MLKLLLNFALEDNLITVNPAARMKELKGGEYRSWTDEELAQFEVRHPPGSMQRRAFAIALFTGQRKSDQVAMTRAHRKNGYIHVAQQKTGELLEIFEHPELSAELARGDQNHMSLLTKSRGKAFDPITGHRTSRMVAHYTKDASKKRQSTAAIIKLTARAK